MARETLALYHPRGPMAWIIRRGWSWLSYGYCPCCYSSPPLPHCPVCEGGRYGRELDLVNGTLWAMRWYKRTTLWKGGATRWPKPKKSEDEPAFEHCSLDNPHGLHVWRKAVFVPREVPGYGITNDLESVYPTCPGRGERGREND